MVREKKVSSRHTPRRLPWSDDQKERMREANPPSAVVMDLGLEVKGGRFKCPWHGGGDYNVGINDARGIVHCFSRCDKKNHDVFGLVQQVLGCTFPEAQDWLAARTPGLTVPEGVTLKRSPIVRLDPTPTKPSAAEFVLPTVNEQVAMTMARDWWHRNLLETPQALEYLTRRGVSLETIRSERIGYSSGSFAAALTDRPELEDAAIAVGILGRYPVDDLDKKRAAPGPGTEQVEHADDLDVETQVRERMTNRIVVWEHRLNRGERHPVWFIGRPPRTIPKWDKTAKYLARRGERPLVGLEDVKGQPAVFPIESQFDRLILLSWGLPSVCFGQAHPGPVVIKEMHNLLMRVRGIFIPHVDASATGEKGLMYTFNLLDLPVADPPHMDVPLPKGVNDVGDLGPVANGLDILKECLPHARAIPQSVAP